MSLKFNLIDVNKSFSIDHKVSDIELDKRKKKELSKGRLKGAEQSFRDDYYWYRLNIGYTNPLNFQTIHAELKLLEKILSSKKQEVMDFCYDNKRPSHQIFYGLGVGDTEIAFVDFLSKQNSAKKEDIFITGIDLNEEFIKNYGIALLNKSFEPHNKQIYFRAYHALFDQLTNKDIHHFDRSSTHFCLGGTIGNFYDQESIIKLFAQNSNKNDHLVLGVQLNSNMKYLFDKYKENPLYPDFILNYLPKKERKLSWSMNTETGFITAVHDNCEVFRTKKYDPHMLRNLVSSKGFLPIKTYVDEYNNSCIQIFLKK